MEEGEMEMRTTTRRWIRNDDVYYDGISWGTPAGQIMFVWTKDDMIQIFHDGVIRITLNRVEDVRAYANGIIKEYFKEV